MLYILLCLLLDVCDLIFLVKFCFYDGYQDFKNCFRCCCVDGLGGDYCEEVQLYLYSVGNIMLMKLIFRNILVIFKLRF